MPTPLRSAALATGFALLLAAGTGTGQEKGKSPPEAKAKKADNLPDAPKGYLPPNWKKLGLSDAQKDKITTISGQYSAEIDRLEERIRELKAKRQSEQLAVLSDEQKKRLEDIYKKKAGTDK